VSILLWLALAIGSLLLFLVRLIFKFSANASWKIAKKIEEVVEEKTTEYKIKSAQISVENWYDKASMTCGETVDALLNNKTGTSERMVRSLAAKLGFAGAGAGLFSIASIFGTASTGTAISTLSGAAFNSAALKWIGGGISMAAGGWVVLLFSLVVSVITYFIAKLTFRKFTGKKRKLKNLDEQEKRVAVTLMLIAVGFRKQADQMHRLDPTSADILYDKVFERLSSELQKCIEKIAHWPTIPRERLRKQADKIQELRTFLHNTARSGRHNLGIVSGAERVDVVPVAVFKLMSNPVPALNTEEKLVLEALRRTNKRKLKKASLEALSEYVRLERIDRLADQLEKVRRIYRKLRKRQRLLSQPEEYTVAFVEAPDRTGVEVLIQNLRTGDASISKIQGSEHNKLLDDSEAERIDGGRSSEGANSEDIFESSGSLDRGEETEILENLSIAGMITLAKSAGAFLSGQTISKQRQKMLVEDGVVMVGVAGLSQLIM